MNASIADLAKVIHSIQNYDRHQKYNKSEYKYQANILDNTIPRVTEILSSVRDQNGLIQWAASINYKQYMNIRNSSTNIGTIVHEGIGHNLERYLGIRVPNDIFQIEQVNPVVAMHYEYEIMTALNNFDSWLTVFTQQGYRINKLYGLEVPIMTPLYGGTADAIVDINGWKYILDFKTSKKISYEYILQVVAYMMGYNEYIAKSPEEYVVGVGIIRVDKNRENVFDDLFMNIYHPYIEEYKLCFLSSLETYYRIISTNRYTSDYMTLYNNDPVILKQQFEKPPNE